MRELMWTAKIPLSDPMGGEWGLDALPTEKELFEVSEGTIEMEELKDELGLGFIRFTHGKWRIFCFNWLKGMAFDDVEEAKAVFISLVRLTPIEPENDITHVEREIGFEDGIPYIASITG